MAVGSWNLLKNLGEGGNAVVWKAERDGIVAALKVLNKTDATSESYRRFRQEVAFLRKLGSYPGILPILDAHVPEEPNKGNRAWLAMPLAIGIREALGVNPPLEQVVDAIRCIAKTLGGVADQEISHRDIKPENLYSHEGQWVVGDFGLVDYPGKQALTKPGRALGPRFYLAPEMVTDPIHADGRPADVYSLAKTLWVLGAGQNYPPPGFQPASISQISLNLYVGHPHANILDQFIKRAIRGNKRDGAMRRNEHHNLLKTQNYRELFLTINSFSRSK